MASSKMSLLADKVRLTTSLGLLSKYLKSR